MDRISYGIHSRITIRYSGGGRVAIVIDNFQAMGAPEEFVKKALEAKEKEVIEFVVNGNTFNVKSEVMKFNHTFELGKEFEETGPMGKKSKNIAKLEGDKLITDSKLEDVGLSRVR